MKINLLPEELRPKKSAILVSLNLKRLVSGFLLLWLILGAFSFFLMYKINYLKKSFSKVEAVWRNAEPLIKERDALLKRKKELNGFLTLLKDGVKRDIFWSKKLASLANLVPEEIWLKEISLEQGIALNVWAAVSYLKSDEELLNKINNFIEEIKKDSAFFKDFQNLALLEINKTGDSNRNIMDFKLRLSLRPGPEK